MIGDAVNVAQRQAEAIGARLLKGRQQPVEVDRLQPASEVDT